MRFSCFRKLYNAGARGASRSRPIPLPPYRRSAGSDFDIPPKIIFGYPQRMPASTKPWFLYLIECRDGSVYTGIAVDVSARYAAHLAGRGARYTRSHPPRRLLAFVEYPDRSSASIAEHAVKQLTPHEKRDYAQYLALSA
jgi:putative endonuclease